MSRIIRWTSDLPNRVLEQTKQTDYFLYLVVGAIFAAHLAVALSHGGPVAVPDIPAYVGYGQWFGGQSPVLPEAQYHPGFGMLLTPLVWLGLDGSELHSAALIMNGILAAFLVVLTNKYAQMLGVSPGSRRLIMILVCVYPGVSSASRVALPETLLTVIVMLTAVLVEKRSSSSIRWAGFICGLSVAIHPRAVTLVFAFLFLLVMKRGSIDKRRALLGLTLGSITTILVLLVSQTWLGPRVASSVNVIGFAERAGVAAGQILAIGAASGGLVLVALQSSGRSLFRKCERIRTSESYLVVGLLGMVVMGGWVLGGGDRPDVMLYSRYVDLWTLPLVVVAISKYEIKAFNKIQLMGATAVAISCAVMTVLLVPTSGQPYRTIMTLPNSWAWQLASGKQIFVVVAVTALTCLLLLALLVGIKLEIIVIALIAVSSLSAVASQVKLRSIGQISENQSTLAVFLQEDPSCISYDRDTTKPYVIWLYRMQLPESEHRSISLESKERPCGRHVLAGVTALEQCDGAEFIKKEESGNWGLWTYPQDGCN